jgi:PAS domain S-box-containing protein
MADLAATRCSVRSARTFSLRYGLAVVSVTVALGLGALLFSVRPLCAADKQTTSRNVPQARINPRIITPPVVDGTDIRFTRLSRSEGLSQTRIAQIVQDNQGFIWFGTQYGLDRYDGYNFKVFVNDPRNPTSLGGVVVHALFKDRNGALWVGCEQFLNRFHPANETFTQYPVPFVTHISQDAAGTLWLATGGGLYSLEPATARIRRYSHDRNDPSSLSSNEVKSSGEDREGGFWVATSEGLDKFDRKTGKVTLHIPLREPLSEFSFYEDSFKVFWIFHASGSGLEVLDRKTNTLTHYSFYERKPPSTAVTGVAAMLEDKNRNLWLGTLGDGLLKFDRERRRFIRYRNDPSDPESLAQDSVISLSADREGNIWAGLGGAGPTHFASTPPPFQDVSCIRDNRHKSDPFVGAIYEDHQGILWTGTRQTLNRIDRNTRKCTSYRITETDIPSDVISIDEDRVGALWVGTYNHGLIRFDPRTERLKAYRHKTTDPYSLSSDIVPRVLVTHKGTIWVTTHDGLDRFDPATGHFRTYRVNSQGRNVYYLELIEDREGRLWLGTESSGLERFDPATGQFTVYQHQANRPGTLSENRVNSVHLDHHGTLWVGTQNGLDKFDPKTNTFAVFTQRDGLPGNAVGCVLEDNHGNLWMSTNNGVSRFNPATRTFNNYSIADGLPGPDLTGWGACFKSPSGEMFFGGFSGGTAFFPDKVLSTSYTPPIVLTEFRLFGDPVEIGDHSPLHGSITYSRDLILSHEQNVFSLSFAALSYSSPSTNRYRYKLEGLDHDWNEVGSDRRQATYTTLPPGSYIFRAQGATSSGMWSEPGVALRVEILPPWWGTWWFRAASAVFILLWVWLFYKLRMRNIQERERQFRKLAENAPDIVMRFDPELRYSYVNPVVEEYAALEPKQMLGRTNKELRLFAKNGQSWEAALQEVFDTGHSTTQEFAFDTPKGERHFESRFVPEAGAEGQPKSVLAITRDISERRLAEEALRRAQADLAHINRVSTLGELTASLAHEIKQPIGAAVTNAEACLRFLDRDQPDLPEAREAALEMARDGRRAADIIEHIRSLHQKGSSHQEMVDVNEVVGEMVRMLHHEAGRHSVTISTALTEILPRVMADRVQLQQVLMNLMLNGVEAMRDTAGELNIKSELAEDGALLISITDAGVGLPPGKGDQIFDAFFTTKPQGTGMGLAITRSIVESHGGRVWATANAGQGTTFQFTLPSKPGNSA